MLLVNVWTTFPSGEGKYQVGYTVTMTKPDKSTQDVQLKSYVADGTSWFTFVPDVVGEWSFVFKFAGEYFPAGYWVSGQYSATRTGSAIFNPSVYVSPATSNTVVVTVQNDLVSHGNPRYQPTTGPAQFSRTTESGPKSEATTHGIWQ